MTKFKKEQKIFKVEIHAGTAIRIHEKEVISCGKKVLRLKGKYKDDFHRVNTIHNFFCGTGKFAKMIEQFHATREEAEKALNHYNNN